MDRITNVCCAVLFFLGGLFSNNALAFVSQASPQSTITLGESATAFIGSQTGFDVTVANTGGAPGYGPYLRLILPPHLTLASSSFLGEALSNDSLGTFSPSPGNTNDDTRASNDQVTGTENFKYNSLVIPLGNVSYNGPTLTTNICVDINAAAQSGTPLTVSVQPVFQYGDTPLGDNGPLTGTTATAQITPTLLTYSTSNDAPSGKQVPGSGFETAFHKQSIWQTRCRQVP